MEEEGGHVRGGVAHLRGGGDCIIPGGRGGGI